MGKCTGSSPFHRKLAFYVLAMYYLLPMFVATSNAKDTAVYGHIQEPVFAATSNTKVTSVTVTFNIKVAVVHSYI